MVRELSLRIAVWAAIFVFAVFAYAEVSDWFTSPGYCEDCGARDFGP